MRIGEVAVISKNHNIVFWLTHLVSCGVAFGGALMLWYRKLSARRWPIA